MTRPMGKFLGNLLGEYVVTDQSRKEEQFGSILWVRVRMDVITKVFNSTTGRQVIEYQYSVREITVNLFPMRYDGPRGRSL